MEEERIHGSSKSSKLSGVQFVSGGVTENKDRQVKFIILFITVEFKWTSILLKSENDEKEGVEDDGDDVITDSDNDEDDFRPQKRPIDEQSSSRSRNDAYAGDRSFNGRSFGAVTSATAYRASREFGTWEKHTRGIGYRLLDKVNCNFLRTF